MFIYDNKWGIYYSTKINGSKFFSGFGTKKTKPIAEIFPSAHTASMKQIHSDVIQEAQEGEVFQQTDGLWTKKLQTILLAQTADCVPIIYVDNKKKIIGISHQGWKGSLKRLSQKMIKSFLNLKSNILDLTVAIGPSIGVCCYDIDNKRQQAFKKEFASYPESIYENREGKTFLNLAYLNFLQLVDVGLTKKQIDFFPFCTKCNKKEFFSFRRDGSPLQDEMTNFVVLQ